MSSPLPRLNSPHSIAEAEAMIAALVTRGDRLVCDIVQRHEVQRQSMRQIACDLGLTRDVVARRLAHVRAACRVAEVARHAFPGKCALMGPSAREKN